VVVVVVGEQEVIVYYVVLRIGLYTNLMNRCHNYTVVTSHRTDSAWTMSNVHGPSMKSCVVSN